MNDDGSIEYVASRLAQWREQSETGIARVDYHSERDRRLVLSYLRQQRLAITEVAVHPRLALAEQLNELFAELEKAKADLVSVSGFDALGMRDSLAESERAFADFALRLNLNRERLAALPIRQIWWLPTPALRIFARVALDLDAWIRPKLTLETDDDNPLERRTGSAAMWRGRELVEKQEYAAARDEFLQALDDAKRSGDVESIARAHSLLGLVLKNLGDDDAARLQMQLALDFALAAYGPDHPDVAASRNNLGVALNGLGEYQAAKEQLQLALDYNLRYDHPSGNNRSNLGLVLQELGEYKAAREQHQLALDSDLAKYGPDHLAVAARHNNLGQLLHDSGKYEEAQHHIQLALDFVLAHYGPANRDVASTRINLGRVLSKLNQHAAAREQFELAIASLAPSVGEAHPGLAVSRLRFAEALHAASEDQQALHQLHQALPILQQKLPPTHPHVKQALTLRAKLAT